MALVVLSFNLLVLDTDH